jgi:polyketide biosynthesis enoyl-CoA hydratase PksI
MPAKVRVTEPEEAIVELNLHDPDNQNRLSEEVCGELIEVLTRLGREPAMKVLVLTGTSDVFCSGATIEILHKLATGWAKEDLSIPMLMLNLPVPVVGALEGDAVGGGLALAMCCDMLVAAEQRRYGFNFTNLGFTPGMGTTSLLPALVGTNFAAEMLMTAKYYKGRDLKDRGLFNYVLPRNEVRDKAFDLARSMADKTKPVLEMLKDALVGPRRLALQEALSRERLMHGVSFSQPDFWSIVTGNYIRNSPA